MCIKTIRAETDQIDVIVHCAASGVHRETTKITMKQMMWTFDINVFSFHSLLAELLPLVPPGGRIIGLSSFGATTFSLPSMALLDQAKARWNHCSGIMPANWRHEAFQSTSSALAWS